MGLLATCTLKVRSQDRSTDAFTNSQSESEASTNFIAGVSSLSLKFTGRVEWHEFENEVSYELRDKADNLIKQNKWTTENSDGLIIQDTIQIDNLVIGNEYKICLHAGVKCGDRPGAVSELVVNFQLGEIK